MAFNSAFKGLIEDTDVASVSEPGMTCCGLDYTAFET